MCVRVGHGGGKDIIHMNIHGTGERNEVGTPEDPD